MSCELAAQKITLIPKLRCNFQIDAYFFGVETSEAVTGPAPAKISTPTLKVRLLSLFGAPGAGFRRSSESTASLFCLAHGFRKGNYFSHADFADHDGHLTKHDDAAMNRRIAHAGSH